MPLDGLRVGGLRKQSGDKFRGAILAYEMRFGFLNILQRLVAISAICLTLIGCGDSSSDNPFDSINDSVQRVEHVNWDTYNLYRFEPGGVWAPVVSRGDVIADLPAIGNSPVIILHGLGSEINAGRFNALAESLRSSGATSVFGFEYDSLDGIVKNGGFFADAFSILTEAAPNTQWTVVGHSMGALVARQTLENGIPFDVAAGSRAVFVAGPHLGSPVANAVQEEDPDVVQNALSVLVLNSKMEFRNVDTSRVRVDGFEQGFTDLRTDSAALAALNANIADHPQFEYRTIAGNYKDGTYAALNDRLGVDTDDGMVDVESANALIGQVDTSLLNFDHSTLVEANDALVQIALFAGF